MENEFDLLILGSGSTAFAAALRAAELGKTAAMTEMRTLGGHVCESRMPAQQEPDRGRAHRLGICPPAL